MYVLLVVNDHQHLLNHVGGSIDGCLIITGDNHVQGIIVPVSDFPISATTCSFFHGPLATNGNLTPRFGLHFLLGFATRANDKADKIVGRMLINGYVNLARTFALHKTRRTERWVQVHELLDTILAFAAITLSPTDCSRILAFPVRPIDRRRARTTIWVAHRKSVNSSGFFLQTRQFLIGNS